jgi:hypothetical protein
VIVFIASIYGKIFEMLYLRDLRKYLCLCVSKKYVSIFLIIKMVQPPDKVVAPKYDAASDQLKSDIHQFLAKMNLGTTKVLVCIVNSLIKERIDSSK